MEWLQSLLDSSTTPALTAFLLGLLTAISPCPRNGLLYTLGRIMAYTLLGIILISILEKGSSLFGIQKFIGKYGEMLLGPALFLSG